MLAIERKTWLSGSQTGRKSDRAAYRVVESGECWGEYKTRREAEARKAVLETIPATLHSFGPFAARRDFDDTGIVYLIADARTGREHYFAGPDALDRMAARFAELARTLGRTATLIPA